jgi:hypothetical protein
MSLPEYDAIVIGSGMGGLAFASITSLTRTKRSFTAFCFELRPRPWRPSLPIPNIWEPAWGFFAVLHSGGGEPAFSSASALCHPGRQNLSRWYPVELLAPPLLLTRAGVVPPVPPIVSGASRGALRGRQAAVHLFTRGTARSTGFPASSRFSARCGMGRLRQTALLRPTASGGLRYSSIGNAGKRRGGNENHERVIHKNMVSLHIGR